MCVANALEGHSRLVADPFGMTLIQEKAIIKVMRRTCFFKNTDLPFCEIR